MKRTYREWLAIYSVNASRASKHAAGRQKPLPKLTRAQRLRMNATHRSLYLKVRNVG